MALEGAAWRNETRAWRRAMLKTPRPNTAYAMAMLLVPTGKHINKLNSHGVID